MGPFDRGRRAQYLDIAHEAIREREGIPGGRANELLEVLEGLRVLIDILEPPTFGTLRLLAHWASQTDVRVPEDELLAELRGVGADECEQATAEAERDLQEFAAGTAEGRKLKAGTASSRPSLPQCQN